LGIWLIKCNYKGSGFHLAGACIASLCRRVPTKDVPKIQKPIHNGEKPGMKKSLQIFVFVLAFGTALTLAQAPASQGSGAGTGSSVGAPAGPGYGNAGTGMPTDQNSSQMGSQTSTGSTASTQPVADDQTLHREVHEQLASNPNLQNVQVAVENGNVTLTGAVNSKDDKKEAKRIAKAVPGVKKVKDSELVVSSANASNTGSASSSQNPAGSISGNAGASTTTSPNAPSTPNPPSPEPAPPHNNFLAQDQSSTSSSSQSGSTSTPDSTSSSSPQSSGSSGATTSPASGAAPESSASPSSTWGSQSSQSQSSTSSTPGTSSSQSGTSTTPGAMGAPAGSSSSDQVRSDIQTAFRNEPTLTSSNISVNVTDDTVELNGSAPSAKDRDEAKRIAQSFAGNRRIVDNLQVGGGSTPDQSSTGNVGSSTGSSSSTTGTTGTSTSNPPKSQSTTPQGSSSTTPNPETPAVPK
jgi:osmotically-inducible protein OsmY